jgi:hypothetical protein
MDHNHGPPTDGKPREPDTDTVVDGLHQQIQIIGRIFDIRTEVVIDAEAVVRTTVVAGGQFVGSRESTVDPERQPRITVREQIGAQHSQIIENLQKRAAELEAEESAEVAPVPTPPVAQRRSLSANEEAPRPELDQDSRLAFSVRVRQLIGPFSLDLGQRAPSDPRALRTSMKLAAKYIDEIMASPTFSEIRLDEQVRFFDLKERLASWRNGDRDGEAGSEVWEQIAVFAKHLRRVSDRRELVEFDYQLLTWAIMTVGQRGVNTEILSDLTALYGRDPDLDRLLEYPEEVEKEPLLEALMGILDRTIV